jgi:arabinogalactan oligomer/maltooligosaccharide transport system permease protein
VGGQTTERVVFLPGRRRATFILLGFLVLLALCTWIGTNTINRFQRGLAEDRILYRSLNYARAAARIVEASRGQQSPHLIDYGNAVGEADPNLLRHLVIDMGATDEFGVSRGAETIWSMHGYNGSVETLDKPVSDRASHLAALFDSKNADRMIRLSELVQVSVAENGYLRVAAYAPVLVNGEVTALSAALIRQESPTVDSPSGLWLLALLTALLALIGTQAFPTRATTAVAVAAASLGIALIFWLPDQVDEGVRGHLAERAADMLEIQGFADTREPVALVSPIPDREPWSGDGALRLERVPGTATPDALETLTERVGNPDFSVHLHPDVATTLTGAPDLNIVLWVIAAAVLLLLLTGSVSKLLQGIFESPGVYGYTGPAVIGLIVLVIFPFVTGIGLSFYRYHLEGNAYDFIGFGNFAEIMAPEEASDINFWRTLGVTVLWTASNVFLHVAIGLALALVLNRPNLKGKKLYRTLLILPWAVPNYITALMWRSMFIGRDGPINSIFGTFGMEPITWFDDNFWTNFIPNLVANTWLGFPFMMVVCLGALQSIPSGLYEAADLDGASRWQRLKLITLPLLKPALLPAVILGTIWTFNMFNIIYLVSMGGGGTEILITEAYRAFHEQHRHGYAAAYAVLIFCMLLSYTFITNRITKAAEGAME